MPDRIQLRRTKGWRKPDGAIVVSRPTRWGNPWKPGQPGGFWLPDWPVSNSRIACHLGAADAVDLYRRVIEQGPDPVNSLLPSECSQHGRRRLRDGLRSHAARIRRDLPELRGRNLCCWCALDQPCHADVLLEMANA